MQNINNILNSGCKQLKKSFIKSPKLDSEILLSHVLNKNLKDMILDYNFRAKDNDVKKFRYLINRRMTREPIAYILRNKEFWKYNFYVNQNVLIPRPDTEIIIEEILKIFKKNQKKSILDIGTGSGCIIISLANELPKIYGTAIDISKKAINVAKFNAKMHQLKNRIKFYNSSVDNFFKGKYDLIVSNPPYIDNLKIKYLEKDVVGFEPLVSLIGGQDGASVLNKVIKKSSSLIKIGGKLVLEIGYNQKYIVTDLLMKKKFHINKIVKDYSNNDRCIIATKL